MGGQEKSTAVSNSMQRVKVYRLNEDGKWDDQGTGHVTVDYLERSEDLGLYVIDEEDNETLLLHRISSDDIYRKQEGTIISWRDPEYSSELALSFQESTGCSYVWDHICNAQRNLHFSTLNREPLRNVSNKTMELPTVELSTLPILLKTFTESSVTEQMRLVELILNDLHFFRKLMDLFHVCEDLENVDGLHMIYKIVKSIVILNSPQIFEKIFGDEFMMDVIGCLEYDPDTPHGLHRNYIRDLVVFKEAIPIKNPLVLSKIHQSYRLGYLKDTILPRVLDDSIVANVNSIIHANNAIVVSLLKDDNTFFQELFARLRLSTTTPESKKNLVYFLHEFCSVSKSLQVVQQHRLFRDLVSEGIFDIITDVLQNEDKRLVLTGTDILILFMNQDPNLLRSYIIRHEGALLFSLLVKGVTSDFGDDMNCQFLEIIRCVLDSYTMLSSQREAIVETFYDKHLGCLLDVIASSCDQQLDACSTSKSNGSDKVLAGQTCAKPEILLNICELLSFCVLHYPYRIKCNFLLNNGVEKILLLTKRRERYLVVAAVRFVRTILSHNDEHIVSFMVKNNLLKPVVEAFVKNGSRYNLLHSAVLEFFEFIRKENLKPLVKYIVESLWDQLGRFDFLATIQSLRVKYDQAMETAGVKNIGNPSENRKRTDDRALDKEEEDYFTYGSDEEDSGSACTSKVSSKVSPTLANGVKPSSVRVGGLVDYDDDDDDEDYKPPPKKLPEASDGEEGFIELVRLKRKLGQKDGTEPGKKPRLSRNPKPRENVFSALCSTLSQAVLPGKKTETSPPSSQGRDKKHCERMNEAGGGGESLAKNNGRLECEQTSESRRLGGEERRPIMQPPSSSPEMAVSGS